MKSLVPNSQDSNDLPHLLILIALILFTFLANVYTAVGILPPMNDDPQRYYAAVHDLYPASYLDSHFLHRGIKVILFKLMTYSPILAKLMNVILFCTNHFVALGFKGGGSYILLINISTILFCKSFSMH